MHERTEKNPKGAGRQPVGRKKLVIMLKKEVFPLLWSGAKDEGHDSINQFAASIIEDRFKELLKK